jgi:hypothetical protein
MINLQKLKSRRPILEKDTCEAAFSSFMEGQWALICFFCIGSDAGIKSIFENYPHVGMNRGYCVLQEPLSLLGTKERGMGSASSILAFVIRCKVQWVVRAIKALA